MCGGSQTTTTTQTQKPPKYIRQAGEQATSQAQAAAAAPFQTPVAPVAEFSGLQNQAFDQISSLGADSPYLAAAQAAFGNAGQAVTADDINQYINPYGDAALANMKKYIFDPQRRDTMVQGRQTAGGPSADRLALTSQNLDFTQSDALTQALAGFYTPAMQQAQRAKEMAMASGTGYLNLQGASQGAVNNLFAAGQQQQNFDQRFQDAQYQNELARLAYPFQTADFLAKNTATLGPSQGGTTTGTQTTPGPSAASQIVGGLTAGAGLMMGNPMMAASGAKGASGMGNYPYSPASGMGNFSPVYMPGYGYMPQASRRGGVIRRAMGGPVNPWDMGRGYDDGGPIPFGDRFPSTGEEMPIYAPPPGDYVEDKWSGLSARNSGTGLYGDPATADAVLDKNRQAILGMGRGSPYYPPTEKDRLVPPIPQPAPAAIRQIEPPPGPAQLTVGPRPAQPPVPIAPRDRDPSINIDSFLAPRERLPYPDATDRDWGQQMARNPWMSLVAAGAKMMQTPGGFGRALGAGFEAGVGHLESQRKEGRAEETLNQRARQLYSNAMEELMKYKRNKYQMAPFIDSRGNPLNFDPATGRYGSGTTGTPIAPDEPLTSTRGPGSRSGAKDPAVVRTAEWMVQNRIAPDLATAFTRLKESNRDSAAYRSLIRQYFSEILKADPMMDRDEAQKEAERRARAGVESIE